MISARGEDHETPLIGTDFFVDFQPYGPVRFLVERASVRRHAPMDKWDGKRIRRNHCWTLDLYGTVIEGSETSRLFQHTSTKDLAGKPYWLSGVRLDEARKGKAVKIAM